MKKSILILISIAAITFMSSCAALKTGVTTTCNIAINTVCPDVESLLSLGITFTVTPTSTAGQYLVSAKGVTTIVCDALKFVCPIIEDALAKGQAVTITPVNLSSNKVKAGGNSYEVIAKFK